MGNICSQTKYNQEVYAPDQMSKSPAFARRLSAHNKENCVMHLGHMKKPEGGRSEDSNNGEEGGRAWIQGRVLAEGAYGLVFAGLDLDIGQPIAIKQVLIPEFMTKNDIEKLKGIENEISVLRNLRHPNIVRYLGTERTEGALYIFLEYAGAGSVAGLLHKYGPLPETVVKVYIRQVLLALDFLHENGYAHRDVKGANILITDNGQIKLGDFGACKQCQKKGGGQSVADSMPFRSLKGTPCFMAPEVIRQKGYGNQVDIWSVGCTIIEMSTGRPPWADKKEDCRIMYNIVVTELPPPFPPTLSVKALDMLSLCFERHPERRPTARQLLNHSFLAEEETSLPSMEGNTQEKVINNNVQDYKSKKDFNNSISLLSSQTYSRYTSGDNSYTRKYIHFSKSTTASNQRTCRESLKSTQSNKDLDVCKHGMVATLKETFGSKTNSVKKLSKLYSTGRN